MLSDAKRFVIFGHPVEHSKSPQMHNAAFKQCKLNAYYETYDLKVGTDLRKRFIKENLSGANITVPHKEIAYEQADEIRGVAKTIGAVNTNIKEDNRIIGFNTDAPGFMKSISSFDDVNHVLILGAGGTARAIAVGLCQENLTVTVLNRSSNRLDFFKQLGCKTYTWDEFVLNHFDLVVNSTSAGLTSNDYPFDKTRLENIFLNARYAFDCIYGKETPFLSLAKKEGLVTKDGEDMLLYQGVFAFEHFSQRSCDDVTIDVMRNALKQG